jgi:hypothetical protein
MPARVSGLFLWRETTSPSEKSTILIAMPTELETLRARLADAEAKLAKKATVTMKVSEKGALSLYGLNAKWPVTLYKEQWHTVIRMAPAIVEFIAANDHKLKAKE